jgi:hypothetical protein
VVVSAVVVSFFVVVSAAVVFAAVVVLGRVTGGSVSSGAELKSTLHATTGMTSSSVANISDSIFMYFADIVYSGEE